MDLSKEDWRILSALLDEAFEIPAAARPAWLQSRTELPAHLLTVASSMINADAFTMPALPGYADSELAALGANEGVDLAPGLSVGPYRLLREIGRGGMGTVWLAERSDGTLKRQVALKLPHSSLPARQLAERFARERDILAALVHPHIARLYDAGLTPQGRPYLALEYVDGEPLALYCSARQLSIGARLELFLQILAAVQYAHNQLAVHRDLKPSNVLVTADGQVRLLDFGIAKLLTDGQAQATELTQLWGAAMTPQYAAPEQILGQPISTAVDVYALGVMLYELLTGALPYRLKRDTRAALEESILDTEPVPPSQAKGVGASPSRLDRSLRGDLDTIILKALKKDPAQRYSTASAFAGDLRRYQRGEPVLAQPDSRWYRSRKFFSRHRQGVAATALVMAGLSASLGAALWQGSVARQEARTASAVKEFMQGIFLASSSQQADPLQARQTTARELLDIGASKLDTALKDAPAAKLEMLVMFSGLYHQLGLYDRSVAFIQQSVALAKGTHGNQSHEVVDGLLRLALTLQTAAPGDPLIAQSLDEAGAILDQRQEVDSTRRGVHSVLAAEYFSDRDILRASEYAERAVVLVRRDPNARDHPVVLAKAAKITLLAGDCAGSKAMAEDGLERARAVNAREGAAEPKFIIFGPLLERLGQSDWCLGDLTAAELHLRQAVDAFRRSFGEDDLDTVRIQARLGELLLLVGKTQDGQQHLTQAATAMEKHSADDKSRMRMDALATLGRTQFVAGQYVVGLDNLTKAIAMRPGVDASPIVAGYLRDKSRVLLALQRHPDAATALDQAIAMRMKSGLRSQAIDHEEGALRQQMVSARAPA